MLPPPRRLQFTLLQLLLLTTAVPIVVVVSRCLYWLRGLEGSSAVNEVLVMVCVFAINVVLAASVALGLARPRWRVVTVLLASALLGVAMSWGSNSDWWLFAMMPLTMSVLPTLIVVCTLLVVRSCGYRLVPLRQ
jgi:hypothetical protein